MFADLYTPQGEALRDDPALQPWQRYPRPQMKRNSYLNLNGDWDFAVSETMPEAFDRTIRVPFCPECALSGVKEHFEEGAGLWYRRQLVLPEGFHQGRVLLHIGAADQIADIYVNQQLLCHHEGGYEAFTVDITGALAEENTLLIHCRDDLNNQAFPYGKQTMTRGGMWYTPVSGIWQTVWLESVPEVYIKKLDMENRGGTVTIDTGDESLSGQVFVKGLGAYPLLAGKARITPANPHFWSPEDPYLYEFTLETETDKVESYFALRSLEIKQVGGYQRLCLNGKPYFFHGLLDQGYWPEGLLTAPAPECYEQDILAMKRLGFNTLRKHIKVEPEEFYYQCDKLGMIVFQDMVNNGDYKYVRDTVIPTVGIQVWPDKNMHADPVARQGFLDGMAAAVNQLKNHPCICCWTIFNEGWGQFDSDSVYEQFRELDDTRFIDSTSGWFRRKKTDVDSRHVYLRDVKLKAGDKPLVLSEFGGFVYKLPEHSFNPDDTYGYGKYEDLREFSEAVEKLYMEQIVPHAQRGLCAAIYTQVSDVEDETNGLLTYDRKVEKLTPQRMAPIAQALQDAVK